MRKTVFITLISLTLLSFSGRLSAQGVDYSVLCTLQQQRTPMMDRAMVWTSNSLVLAPTSPLALMAVGWGADNDNLLHAGTRMGLSFLIAGGITEGLKLSVRRQRPYKAYADDLVPVKTTSGFSFPSGHTSLSFAVATSLSLSYREWYVVVPSLLWAAGVGFSRLYLGVHYPSDVLVGMLVGTGSAILAHYLTRRLDQSSPVPATKAFMLPLSFSF